MATLEKRARGSFRLIFRFGGKRYACSLKTADPRVADASRARVEDQLRRVSLGTLRIPPDADVAAFLLSEGAATEPPPKEVAKNLQLGQLFADYFERLPENALEPSTISLFRVHEGHFLRHFGKGREVAAITADAVQGYIAARSRMKGRGSPTIGAATIRKELSTLSLLWGWAVATGRLSIPYPKSGYRFPKTDDKPPFMTLAEIERKLSRGKFNAAETKKLWDSLFLTAPEVEALLEHVRTAARFPFVYPMVVFAAFTGARRSELIRSRLEDIDLEQRFALLREKKRVKGRNSTRRVPLSPVLVEALTAWLAVHPGGGETFVQPSFTGGDPEPLTMRMAAYHFKRVLAGSKWNIMKGWHVLRHSFIGNCAARGVDQRYIDAWVGHTNEETRRRYRHLIPDAEHEALQAAFGTPKPSDPNGKPTPPENGVA